MLCHTLVWEEEGGSTHLVQLVPPHLLAAMLSDPIGICLLWAAGNKGGPECHHIHPTPRNVSLQGDFRHKSSFVI